MYIVYIMYHIAEIFIRYFRPRHILCEFPAPHGIFFESTISRHSVASQWNLSFRYRIQHLSLQSIGFIGFRCSENLSKYALLQTISKTIKTHIHFYIRPRTHIPFNFECDVHTHNRLIHKILYNIVHRFCETHTRRANFWFCTSFTQS